MNIGTAIYFTVGISVLLPLGARIAGNPRLARRLDLLPRFAFGSVCLMLAIASTSAFFYVDDFRRTLGPAPELTSRILFGILGIALIGSGIRILIKRDFDRPDSDA